MNVKRFEAPSMAGALEMIRSELGSDAVIISSRKRTARGFLPGRSREVIEVIAGLPEEGPSVAPAAPAEAAAPTEAQPVSRATAKAAAALRVIGGESTQRTSGDGAAALEISAAAQQAAAKAALESAMSGSPDGGAASEPAAAVAPAAASGDDDEFTSLESLLPQISRAEQPSRAEEPNGGGLAGAQYEELLSELAELRRLVLDTSPKRLAAASALPPAAQEFVARLRWGGVSDALVAKTCEAASDLLDAHAGRQAAEKVMQESLLSLIPACSTPTYDYGKTTVLHLVGPAGAGKTLAAVRLARRLSVAERYPVVLANADQQRPGASAQLQAYGEALGIPTAQIYDAADLKETAAAHPGAVIVLDTTGGLPRRAAELARYKSLTNAIRRRRVFLTLDCTRQEPALLLAYEAFRNLKLSGVILTKADETDQQGTALSFLSNVETPLLFLSSSNDALDDLKAAGPAALLSRVLQHHSEDARRESIAS